VAIISPFIVGSIVILGISLFSRYFLIVSVERLLNILHELSTLDVDIKSGKVDRFQGFELFLLKDL
jgi:DNA polymerase III delta subunit